MGFCIFAVSVIIFPFSFLIVYLGGSFLFLLVSLARDLSNLLLVLLNFSIVSFTFCFIYFLSDLYYFLPFADFSFFFFLIILSDRLGCLRFCLFFEEGLYHYKLPFKNCFCCLPQILYGCVFIVIFLKLFLNFLSIL